MQCLKYIQQWKIIHSFQSFNINKSYNEMNLKQISLEQTAG